MSALIWLYKYTFPFSILTNMRYRIPKSWADITIGQFQEINRLDKTDELDYLINLVSVLCHISIEVVEGLTITQLRAMGAKLSFISKMPEKFVNDFKLNGKHYVVDCNIAHISTGQYVDLGKYTKEGTEENIHKILTIFCLPTTRTWFKRKPLKYGEGYSLNALADEFKAVPFDIAYPLSVFFCKLLEKSMPVIQVYLERELKTLKNMEQEQKVLKNTGAGLR